ncbi:MAG: DUF3857 and transglutaminase domain-containing protein [Chitinophagaceae bacterium]
MNFIRPILVLISLSSAINTFSQTKSSFRFEKIGKEDFAQKIYSIDSNAAAVILADVGSSGFEGNNKGWFSLVFKRHRRIRILNKSAVELATIQIPLYRRDDDEESLEDVKATTYNEMNGVVTETPLDKHDIFSEKLDKNHSQKKFTMPAVKDGSIIDLEYTIKSDFTFNLQPWTFQHLRYPCLWSEYSISVPGLLNYVFIKQGYHKYFIEKKDTKSQGYKVTMPAESGLVSPQRDFFISSTDTRCRWVIKDLPGFNDVDYISTPDNYVDKVEFQLSQVSDGQNVKDVMDTWPKVMEQLMKEDDFGGPLTSDNYWLDKDIEVATSNAGDQLEAAKRIYDFVRTTYTCSGNGFLIKTKLSDVYKNRKGNAGEINLILTAMLRKKGIIAEPVLLSTRSNGRPHDHYPMLAKYDYAICRATIGEYSYCLDATHHLLGFGKLDPECYNGPARVVSTSAPVIDFETDSLKENKSVYVQIINQKGVLKGSFSKMPGFYESYHLRDVLSKDGKETYLNDIKKSFVGNVQVENLQFDSLALLDQPIGIHYDFTITPDANGTIYLNPLFGEGYEKNYFKSEERILPVEMSFPANRSYVLNLDVPDGYIVDELPKPVKVKLNQEGDGVFEYIIENRDNKISLRTRLFIRRTFFSPDEYDMLREFFNLVLKKQNENIVFKKKS